VHTMGNAIKCLLDHQTSPSFLSQETVARTVEELLRYDPPLHVFTRFVQEDMELAGVPLKRGDEVALVLASANRDSAICSNAEIFEPARAPTAHMAFGGGIHFCVGAPLARLELQIALPALFAAFPDLRLLAEPRYTNTYHFHKLDHLHVSLA